jgi:hypothetical protein
MTWTCGDRSSAGACVQLFVAGRASAEGSSPASSTGGDGRDSARDVGGFRLHVCAARPSVDSTEEVVAGAVAADAVLGALGAAGDGGNRLQHAVPLVGGAKPGRRGVGCDQLTKNREPLLEADVAKEFLKCGTAWAGVARI